MPDWAAFALATAAVTLLLLFLTRRSQRLLNRARIVDSRSDVGGSQRGRDVGYDADSASPDCDDAEGDPVSDAPSDLVSDAPSDRPVLTTRLLLANAAASQAGGLVVLAAIAWWTSVPASAFGVGGTHPTLGAPAFGALGTLEFAALGVTAGVALAAGNEAVARLGERVGLTPSDRLRRALTPGSSGEWVLLLVVALPTVAVFEEALFRGALVGALAVGFAVDPWLLAVGSSVAFGLCHGAQGGLGIVAAAALGLALAGLFVATGSLLVPIVAHYVVNAVEFAARETP